MGNKTKKFRQISTKAHRTGHRGKNKRTRSAARGREKAAALLIYTTLASFLLFAAFYIVVYLITSRAYYKIVAVEQ